MPIDATIPLRTCCLRDHGWYDSLRDSGASSPCPRLTLRRLHPCRTMLGLRFSAVVVRIGGKPITEGSMRTRERTKKPHEREGGWTYVRSALCPCRPCYSPRACGHYNSQGEWVTQIECATRQNSGCPLPPPKPKHVFAAGGLICERCGRLAAPHASAGG